MTQVVGSATFRDGSIVMALVVNCPCGESVNADDIDTLVAGVTEHVNAKHPDMADTVTRESVMAMALEV